MRSLTLSLLLVLGLAAACSDYATSPCPDLSVPPPPAVVDMAVPSDLSQPPSDLATPPDMTKPPCDQAPPCAQCDPDDCRKDECDCNGSPSCLAPLHMCHTADQEKPSLYHSWCHQKNPKCYCP